MKKLMKFYKYFGRMGKIEGTFIVDDKNEAELKKYWGQEIILYEYLGKHSECSVELNDTNITLVTDNQDFLNMADDLKISLTSGFNPLDYLDELEELYGEAEGCSYDDHEFES